ncbi:hypothetical protein FOA52_005540 [Chlamydomonas sp. UWO 241]|nr:hypothetical protein FOA52_005540 [Chlamydomonas sp. UWO 241]
MDEARVTDLMTSAFGTPLTAPTEMVRFTFLVGGGKLVRTRYPDDLPKWTTAALRSIGFTEDRSAAETYDSQGTFKQQHDTGQNLKYVVVYPHVACASAPPAAAGGDGRDGPAKSPAAVMCSADLELFKKRLASKTSSWLQCRRLLKLLQDHVETVKAIEEKLCSGAALSPAEQAKYDSNSGVDDEKIAWLQTVTKGYVDEGKLSATEKAECIEALTHNLATLDEKLSEAQAAGKAKMVEKLQGMKAEGLAKKAVLDKAVPIPLRLKHGDEVQALRLKILPLVELEAGARSCSLTMDDLKKLSVKPDLEEEIGALESASRGWFEADEDFAKRCAYEEKEATRRHEAKKKVKGGAKAGTGSAWSAVASGGGAGKKPGASAPKRPTGFAALAMLDD